MVYAIKLTHIDNITLIHLGDLHGQIESHGNLPSDNKNKNLEGGLARVYTKMKAIRNKAKKQNTLDPYGR